MVVLAHVAKMEPLKSNNVICSYIENIAGTFYITLRYVPKSQKW